MAFRTNKTPILQEKSASGAVATFNTALAMPLASCNIAVNAYQEGTGDPSPSNVRPIHGFSEVNAYQRAVNLWDEEWEVGSIDVSTGVNARDNNAIRSINYIPVKPETSYFIKCGDYPNTNNFRARFYDKNYKYIGSSQYGGGGAKCNSIFKTPVGCYYMRHASLTNYGNTYLNDISINYPSTDTDYHAYTGNIYTIQLGQEVYGAEVDVDNGVATVTFSIIDLGNLTWRYLTSSTGTKYFGTTLQGAKMGPNNNGNPNGLCDRYKLYGLTSINNLPNFSIEYGRAFAAGIDIAILDDRYTDETTFNNDISGTYLMYELATPFDIQLTPTQIETLIGNNTIFADTGDIDLTFKDLDIAKRGNFREVFKLPS